jgi:hypothetical protein
MTGEMPRQLWSSDIIVYQVSSSVTANLLEPAQISGLLK